MEIKSNDFHAMPELEYLNFQNNSIQFISTDAFLTLLKLKIISLNYNQIEKLPQELFDTNLKLLQIHVFENKMRLNNLNTRMDYIPHNTYHIIHTTHYIPHTA